MRYGGHDAVVFVEARDIVIADIQTFLGQVCSDCNSVCNNLLVFLHVIFLMNWSNCVFFLSMGLILILHHSLV